MKISLLHPSRGRPEKSFNNSKEWIEKAGCNVELIVSVDSSDNLVSEYLYKYDTCVVVRHNSSVVEATNHAAKVATGDILLYLSDDFKCFDNWGLAVLKEFEGESRPLLLKVDDCLQKFTVPVLTIPIMNRQLYERLGYFWHPEYKSMHVDVDLFYTCQKIGAIKNCEYLKFPHEHPANGKSPDDDTYRRSAANWNQGLEVFNRRKALGFPI
jgi:glycosyltransferase involved in cell wall biosynthesis